MPDFTRTDKTLAGRRFERILLVKPSSLGDVVHALPVLSGLRARHPDAKIDWLVATAFAPILDAHPDLDEIVCFDRRRFARVGRSPNATGGFIRFVHALRRRRYDLVLDLQGLFRSGFLTRMTGAPVRIGFRNAREGAWVFYTHHLVCPNPDSHAVDRYYLASEMLGFAEVPVRFHLPSWPDVTAKVGQLLRDSGGDRQKPLVVIAPTARWETKVWPLERFAEALDRISGVRPAQVVLVAGKEDASRCDRIRNLCQSKPVNLAGRTTLKELVALIRLADLVICHDSAVAHLAVAMERALVCITGPTNPRRTGPYGRAGDVVRLDLECSPCYLRHKRQCPYDIRCMTDLGADAVVTAAVRVLESRASAVV